MARKTVEDLSKEDKQQKVLLSQLQDEIAKMTIKYGVIYTQKLNESIEKNKEKSESLVEQKRKLEKTLKDLLGVVKTPTEREGLLAAIREGKKLKTTPKVEQQEKDLSTGLLPTGTKIAAPKVVSTMEDAGWEEDIVELEKRVESQQKDIKDLTAWLKILNITPTQETLIAYKSLLARGREQGFLPPEKERELATLEKELVTLERKIDTLQGDIDTLNEKIEEAKPIKEEAEVKTQEEAASEIPEAPPLTEEIPKATEIPAPVRRKVEEKKPAQIEKTAGQGEVSALLQEAMAIRRKVQQRGITPEQAKKELEREKEEALKGPKDEKITTKPSVSVEAELHEEVAKAVPQEEEQPRRRISEAKAQATAEQKTREAELTRQAEAEAKRQADLQEAEKIRQAQEALKRQEAEGEEAKMKDAAEQAKKEKEKIETVQQEEPRKTRDRASSEQAAQDAIKEAQKRGVSLGKAGKPTITHYAASTQETVAVPVGTPPVEKPLLTEKEKDSLTKLQGNLKSYITNRSSVPSVLNKLRKAFGGVDRDAKVKLALRVFENISDWIKSPTSIDLNRIKKNLADALQEDKTLNDEGFLKTKGELSTHLLEALSKIAPEFARQNNPYKSQKRK